MRDSSLNIIIEDKVPYLRGVFEKVGANVTYLPAEKIDRGSARDANVLVVRTRTRCNAELLEGSRVSLVASATIGMDHIDKNWCEANGIEAVNAPGCNAPAVAQYVFAALMELVFKPISSHTIAIIGVGNVGRIVERWARGLGMKVLRYDPPRQRAEGGDDWASLNEIAEKADIVTFHTPLTREGEDPTWHMADRDFFNALRRAPIVVNAARGGVMDEEALLEALECGRVRDAVIDCWENEPRVSRSLVKKAAIATPHIAGYSAAGKARASQAVVNAVCRKFGLEKIELDVDAPSCARTVTARSVASSYSPSADSEALKTAVMKESNENELAKIFESFRNEYPLRDEAPEGKED